MVVEAKAPAQHITAGLQIDCSASGMSLAVDLDLPVPKTGAVGWSIQIDGVEMWHDPARRYLYTTHIQLMELHSDTLKVLQTAKRLRLTLQPTVGDELPYDFDVSGGAVALEKMDCPIKRFY
jgi:hypothetical protein